MSFSTIKLILTLACEESTRLVSESLDRDLPWGERWAVRLHAVCCRSCSGYRKQIELLREALRRYGSDTGSPALAGASLSADAREKMIRALADEPPSDS